MNIIALFAVAIILAGCGDPPTSAADKVPAFDPPKVDTVTFKRYRISDTEHMVLLDIPDRFVPRRCAVFVDDLTKTSHMSCEFDGVGQGFPDQGE